MSSSALHSLLSLGPLTPSSPLVSYDPLATILQNIINTLKSHESKIDSQDEMIKALRDENRKEKLARQKMQGKLSNLEKRLAGGDGALLAEDSTDNQDDDSLNDATLTGIDPDEYASLMQKTDHNADKMRDMDAKFDDVAARIDNLVALVQTVSEVAKNGEKLANEAQGTASGAERLAHQANQAAKQAEEDAAKLKEQTEELDAKVDAVHDETSKAAKAASEASKSSADNSKSIEDIQSRLSEMDKNLAEYNKTMDNLKNAAESMSKKEIEEKQNLLEPDVPVNKPKQRETPPQDDHATKKEVQLLRNILVRFENDLHNLYDFMQQLKNTGDVQQLLKNAGNTGSSSSNSSDKSKSIAHPQSEQKSTDSTTGKQNTTAWEENNTTTGETKSGSQSARLNRPTSGSTNAHSTGYYSARSYTDKDDDEELRRQNYNTIRRLPSRDIRSQYTSDVAQVDTSGDNSSEQSTHDKMYNTLAVTLNEVLGRVDILESAVAELQSLLNQLQRNADLNATLGRPVSSHSSAGASSDDIEKVLHLLQQKADKNTVENLSKDVQELLSRVSGLQRELENKADADNTVDMSRFRDLETKIVKKVDRSEMQAFVSKFLSDQRHAAASSISPMKKRSDSTAQSSDKKFDAQSIVDLDKLKEVISAHAHDINTLFKTKADKSEVFRELSDYKEILDRLDQVKADANIVARKAEREYVDNVLDKLKRDLESFVNNLNAHTSDLFAKDLEYLRGLIDQKSSKGDVKKMKDILRRWSTQDVKKTDGGLAGHKQFRCLSCNREMESMRTHPASMNFLNFVNHLPNPKNKLYPRKAFLNDPLSKDTMRAAQQIQKQQHDTSATEHENGYEEDRSLPPLQK
mmetsp:Transcript_34/g.135  ORF Transcript_34/g.135 Transcript_34/m.135 type:complete len:861 (-) Transcript_34:70-2652(-)|eukprot:CAMPEP_0117449554 /NCGR_PEP_ID=MMETSP0759-20121206/8005_1 /TAXON_ID=63605 /ORGANISM="Percolomonas cosmopolitus, Strain WS" /LENGTH=860 /DNA_ID=CAMNT_0005242033 /DNA_START=287 /DNA_END=2869 /DNA_ORIENTATION=-